MYPSPLPRRRLRHLGLLRHPPELRHARRLSRRSCGAAHARGLRVITELVLNHTSDQHPWFEEARSSRDNPKRDCYVWSDTDDTLPRRPHHLLGHRDARTGRGIRSRRPTTGTASSATSPTSTTTTRPCARRSGRSCGSGSTSGVDGFRVDAVPYLVEREGTSCENLPETHDVLQELRAAARRGVPRAGCCSPRRTCGPRRCARTSATATSSTWRSTSRSCRGCSWRCGSRTGSRWSTSSSARRRFPTRCQWGIFLRNHDELTLEMVTDVERDYMYDEYARGPGGPHQPRHPAPAGAAARRRPPPHRADERRC